MLGCAAAQFRKNEEIEEVHHTQYNQHQSNLAAQDFQGGLRIGGLIAILQCQRHESDVDEIKSDHQQMIDRIGQSFISQEAVHEKNTTVFVQGSGDPDRQGYADDL